MSDDREYRVVLGNLGCELCDRGKMWQIVDSEGDQFGGITYGDEDEALEVCGLVNAAFQAGEARGKSDVAQVESPLAARVKRLERILEAAKRQNKIKIAV